jgi:hypothetical protein
MPVLKKLFIGFNENTLLDNPLERKIIFAFQAFCEKRYPNIFFLLTSSYSRGDHEKQARLFAEKVLKMPSCVTGAEDFPIYWKTILSVVQWLGTSSGQCFLKEIDKWTKKK